MKRIERLGSVAFATVTIGLTFHLLAMSFNYWVRNIYIGPDAHTALSSWHTSINQRCYITPVGSIFSPANSSKVNISSKAFVTDLCIPNKYIVSKSQEYEEECYQAVQGQADVICSLGDYNPDHCTCDYTSTAKATFAMTVLASITLGIMVFLSHLISFVKIDYILKWLIPVCFILLSSAILFMFIALIIVASTLTEDVNELRYYWTLTKIYFGRNVTALNIAKAEIDADRSANYTIKVGWCFGLEILALYFSVVSLILYTLIFLAKQRPEPKK